MTRRTLTLTLDLEGAAFGDFPEQETSILLRLAAAKIGAGAIQFEPDNGFPLIDSDGNTVGEVAITDAPA